MPVTPTLSVEAVQPRLTWVELTAVALSPVGVVGGVVSGPAGVTGVFMSVWTSAGVECPLVDADLVDEPLEVLAVGGYRRSTAGWWWSGWRRS